MPSLRYTAEKFGAYMGPALEFGSEIRFSWSSLCRAAMTVGRRDLNDVLRFGSYSVLECLWRVAMLRANLVEDPAGQLRKSGAFMALDRSEKGAVSYFLGLTVAKLIAERLFGVAWLLHLDVYSQYLSASLAFDERPDLVGADASGYWIVLEAKGRTGRANEDMMVKAKRQTRSLRQVGGEFPIMRIAIATHFQRMKLSARVRDPEGFDEGAPDLDIEPGMFMRAYYRPLVEVVENLQHEPQQNPRDGRTYIQAQLPGLDATIALDEEVLKWYQSPGAPWRHLRERLLPQPGILAELQHRKSETQIPEDVSASSKFADDWNHPILGLKRLWEDLPIGLDGVSIGLGRSWSPEYMRREPSARGDASARSEPGPDIDATH